MRKRNERPLAGNWKLKQVRQWGLWCAVLLFSFAQVVTLRYLVSELNGQEKQEEKKSVEKIPAEKQDAPVKEKGKEGKKEKDDLLKSLDDELFGDEADEREKKSESKKKEADGRDDSPGEELKDKNKDLKKDLDRELSPDGEEENPLESIARRMQEVETLISKNNAGEKSQRLQEELTADLQKLIQELIKKQQQQQQKAGSSSKRSRNSQAKNQQPGKKPGNAPGKQPDSRPSSESRERLGKNDVRKADPEAMRNLLKAVWGQLPEKMRDQLIQASPEKFLPKYELQLEQYFRSLAEPREGE